MRRFLPAAGIAQLIERDQVLWVGIELDQDGTDLTDSPGPLVHLENLYSSGRYREH